MKPIPSADESTDGCDVPYFDCITLNHLLFMRVAQPSTKDPLTKNSEGSTIVLVMVATEISSTFNT